MIGIQPPLDGSIKSLPELADLQAKHNPSLPWLIFPSKDASGTSSISYAGMVEASHRIAHIFRPKREGLESEVVAVILDTDAVLYVAVLLGLMRAGLIVSLILFLCTRRR